MKLTVIEHYQWNTLSGISCWELGRVHGSRNQPVAGSHQVPYWHENKALGIHTSHLLRSLGWENAIASVLARRVLWTPPSFMATRQRHRNARDFWDFDLNKGV